MPRARCRQKWLSPWALAVVQSTIMKSPKRPYKFHPACLAFPLLGDGELQELADDIKLQGLRHPIVVYQGQILDGRNRLAACDIAGVPPRFIGWTGTGSPVEWVISTNLHRRHLTASQRAIVALDILPLLEKEAKERQRRSPGRGKKVAHDCATFSANSKASEAAAQITRAGSRYVEAAKSISKAAPELIEKIRGGQLSVPNAKRVADLPPSLRARVLRSVNGEEVSRFKLADLIAQARTEDRRARVKKARRPGGDQGILVGDMSLLWKRLKDNSVDLFLSDPPYNDVQAYERLAELAAAKLKPGTMCLAYAGQMYLPEVLAAMCKHLKYWWTFSVVYDKLILPIHPRHIKNKWKPVIAFAKPPIKPAPEWMLDAFVGAGRDKEYHEWGQGEAEAVFFLEQLTEPGALVVDPYAGGAAFLVAAKRSGRRWLATERDEATALIARKRLAQPWHRAAETSETMP